MKYLDHSFDEQFRVNGIINIAGIDEAGRGPLAGPVVAAAVILPIDFINEIGINDSKKIKESKRDEMANIIKENALAYAIEFAGIEEIEEKNILQATVSVMRRSAEKLKIIPNFLLIDGNYFPNWKIKHKCIKKGDTFSLSIAAASILAKTARDKYMLEVAHKAYPKYNFAKHKGYGTKEHYRMLDEFGVCPIHRPSFLKKYFARQMEIDF